MLAPSREHVSDHIKRLLAEASSGVPRRDDHCGRSAAGGPRPRKAARQS
ncbi:MAG: hypothetical protein ABSE47_11200 [Acidimicrobiales bacterium]